MKSLENQADDARVRSGPGGATNATPTLEHSDLAEGDRAMSRCGYNGDSTPNFNSPIHENWQPIGAIAAKLVAKAVR